jgi:hypothetical protein
MAGLNPPLVFSYLTEQRLPYSGTMMNFRAIAMIALASSVEGFSTIQGMASVHQNSGTARLSLRGITQFAPLRFRSRAARYSTGAPCIDPLYRGPCSLRMGEVINMR